MEFKYAFTGEQKKYKGTTLKQIVAAKDFGEIKAGTIGGWVKSVNNLSQEGNCWVGENAQVWGNAYVGGNATVRDHAQITGSAIVCDEARVLDYAIVAHHSKVCDQAIVYGKAQVLNGSTIRGKAKISVQATIAGQAIIEDNAVVYGSATVADSARVKGNVIVSGNTTVIDNAELSGNWELSQGVVGEEASLSNRSHVICLGYANQGLSSAVGYRGTTQAIVRCEGRGMSLQRFQQKIESGDYKLATEEYRLFAKMVELRAKTWFNFAADLSTVEKHSWSPDFTTLNSTNTFDLAKRGMISTHYNDLIG